MHTGDGLFDVTKTPLTLREAPDASSPTANRLCRICGQCAYGWDPGGLASLTRLKTNDGRGA